MSLPATTTAARAARSALSRQSRPSSHTLTSTLRSFSSSPIPSSSSFLLETRSRRTNFTSNISKSVPKHFDVSKKYATLTEKASSTVDPAEEEAQKHLEQGTNHLENGEMELAKRSYLKSLEIKQNSSALFNLGVCHYHERELELAIQAWEKSLELSPESSDAHTNLASAYVLSKPSRPDLAVEHLKKAAQINPKDAEVQYNLAAVLEACEQLEEALVAYKRAFEGGIARAEQNIRNCTAKILGAKYGPDVTGDLGLGAKKEE
ncbi:HCP-like protein [Violaceomyces palustris]|uniref:HCP-like protein n=1 Tax=Violaceomyces palustris TaxID=1673888 RepID=A0ACD0P1Q8_9BASI|nr:HCP-like protein [Violaceomyces palustris]